jgi:hypothetical protein
LLAVVACSGAITSRAAASMEQTVNRLMGMRRKIPCVSQDWPPAGADDVMKE